MTIILPSCFLITYLLKSPVNRKRQIIPLGVERTCPAINPKKFLKIKKEIKNLFRFDQQNITVGSLIYDSPHLGVD